VAYIQNDNKNDKQQNSQLSAAPMTSTGAPAPNPSPSQQGSGRFQNLNKYMSANQGAGSRLGAGLESGIRKEVSQKQKEAETQAGEVRKGIESAQPTLGMASGFESKLGGIKSGLESFKGMEDREGFDLAGQQAQEFTQDPNFSKFRDLQTGQVLDENALRQQQQQAANVAQQSQALAQQRLQQSGTEAGRFNLLKSMIGGKQYGPSYSGSAGRLDQLLLQRSPEALKALQQTGQQLQSQTGQLVGSLGEQAKTLEDVATQEAAAQTSLTSLSDANRELFNTKLGQQSNLDYINNLRQQKYNDLMAGLKTGNITREQADAIGLGDIQTYNPTAPTSIGPIGGKTGFDTGGVTATKPDISQIRTYNALRDIQPETYFSNPQLATGLQDIMSGSDYSSLQALANIANKDTFGISGASNLGSAIKTAQGQKSLADLISEQNQKFTELAPGQQTATMSETRDGQGISGTVTAKESLENYLKNRPASPQSNLFNMGATFDESMNKYARASDKFGNDTNQDVESTKLKDYLKERTVTNLYNQLEDQLAKSGYGNVLNVTNPTEAPKYSSSRYKGLL